MSLPEGVTNVIDGALSFIYSFEPLVEKTLVLGRSSTLTGRMDRFIVCASGIYAQSEIDKK